MRSFDLIDRVLLISGCNLFTSSHIVACLQRIQQVILVVICLFNMYGDSYTVITDGKLLGNLNITYYIPSYICSLVFLAIMIKQRSIMQTFIQYLEERIPPAEHRRLRRLAAVWISLFTLLNLSFAGMYIHAAIHHQAEGIETSFYSVLWLCYYYHTLCSRWPILTCLLIVFFVESMKTLELTFLQRVIDELEQRTCCYKSTRIELHGITLCVMDLLSVIPCIFVAYLFSAATGLILHVKTNGFSRDIAIEAVTIAVYVFVFAYVTVVCDKCRRQVQGKVSGVRMAILKTRNAQWTHLMIPLNRMTSYGHQSCRILSLNCQFFLTFISALITFAALVVQFSS